MSINARDMLSGILLGASIQQEDQSILFVDVGNGSFAKSFIEDHRVLELYRTVKLAEPRGDLINEIFENIKEFKSPKIEVELYKVEKYVLTEARFSVVVARELGRAPTVISQNLYDLKSLTDHIVIVEIGSINVGLAHALASEHFETIVILNNFMVLS